MHLGFCKDKDCNDQSVNIKNFITDDKKNTPEPETDDDDDKGKTSQAP